MVYLVAITKGQNSNVLNLIVILFLNNRSLSIGITNSAFTFYVISLGYYPFISVVIYTGLNYTDKEVRHFSNIETGLHFDPPLFELTYMNAALLKQ